MRAPAPVLPDAARRRSQPSVLLKRGPNWGPNRGPSFGKNTCAEFRRGLPRTAPRSHRKPPPRCARRELRRRLPGGRIGRTLACTPGMSLWHVILACHSGMSQMMLAIFSTQGRINRAFFDQRAEKDTPGRLAVESPGTLYLRCAGAWVGGAGKGSRARGRVSVFAGIGLINGSEYVSGRARLHRLRKNPCRDGLAPSPTAQ